MTRSVGEVIQVMREWSSSIGGASPAHEALHAIVGRMFEFLADNARIGDERIARS